MDKLVAPTAAQRLAAPHEKQPDRKDRETAVLFGLLADMERRGEELERLEGGSAFSPLLAHVTGVLRVSVERRLRLRQLPQRLEGLEGEAAQ